MPALSCRHVLFCSCEKISKIIDFNSNPINATGRSFLIKNYFKLITWNGICIIYMVAKLILLKGGNIFNGTI